MKEPPSQTFAHLLADLYAVPGEFIACLEWQRIPSDRMRRDLQTRRRHFFNKRVSIVNYVTPEARPEEMLVDDSASATVRQLGDALTELEVNGHFFGSCSLTLVLHGEDERALQHQTAEAMKAMAVHDGSLFEETYNLLNAWLSIVPGNSAHNLRRLALLGDQPRRPELPVHARRGRARQPAPAPRGAGHLRDAAPTRPYAFNLHVQDVGHTLVLGRDRAAARASCSTSSSRTRRSTTRSRSSSIWGTATGSSRRCCGAAIWKSGFVTPTSPSTRLRSTRRRSICISCMPSCACSSKATTGTALSDLEDREVYDAIENLYVLDRSQRRLFTVANLLPRALAGRLHKWIEGGRYASLFDNLHDTLTVERLQVFDFEAMRAYPALLEPLLFYVLHRVTARIQDPAEAATLKLCVMDEAWRFIQHPTLRAYVQEGLKTWRKRNAAMMLSTQTIDDFASADLLRTVVESCPTKLLLANPALDRATVRRAVSVERDGTGTARRADPPTADPAQASRCHEGAHPDRRPEELLDLHEYARRQRTGRRDVS